MNVFDLAARITLDRSQYDEELNDAGQDLEGFGTRLKKGLGNAAKIGGAAIAAVTAAGVAITKAVLDGAAKTAEYGDNIDKMSQKLGISAQAYQEWDAILQHSGASIDSMQRGMMTLAAAAENGSEAFEQIGLSQEQVAKMNQEELFAAVIEGLQGIEDEGKRAVLAQKLLGGSAKELGALLNTSAEDVEEMRKRVHELGGVMSDEAVKAAASYQDSLQDMTTAFKGLSRGLFTQFMPSITTVMDGLTEIFAGNSEEGIGLISTGIDDLVTNITDKLPEFIDLGLGILGALGNAIIDNLPKLMESAGMIIGQIIAGIVSALPRIIEQAPEIIAAIVSGLSAAWPEIKAAGGELLSMLWEGIVASWGWFTGVVSEQFGLVKDNLTQTWEEMKNNANEKWQNLVTSVTQKIDTLKTNIKTRFDNIKTTIKNIIDKIKGFFNFEWELPHIKLPHFAISPSGWKFSDLLQGSIPTLGIEWYKKAYDEPYVFTKPTVVPGFGDGVGGEMVYGRDNLMRDIREAMGDGNVTINVYPSKGQSPEEIAKEVERVFVARSRQRRLLNA